MNAMLFMSSGSATTEGFGFGCFKGVVVDKYLSKYGEFVMLFVNGNWIKDMVKVDIVVKAVFDWVVDNGVSVYCYWF